MIKVALAEKIQKHRIVRHAPKAVRTLETPAMFKLMFSPSRSMDRMRFKSVCLKHDFGIN